MKNLWLLVACSSLLGGIGAVVDFGEAETVLQVVQAMSIGMAMAVIPYCLTRAVDEATKKNR